MNTKCQEDSPSRRWQRKASVQQAVSGQNKEHSYKLFFTRQIKLILKLWGIWLCFYPFQFFLFFPYSQKLKRKYQNTMKQVSLSVSSSVWSTSKLYFCEMQSSAWMLIVLKRVHCEQEGGICGNLNKMSWHTWVLCFQFSAELESIRE